MAVGRHLAVETTSRFQDRVCTVHEIPALQSCVNFCDEEGRGGEGSLISLIYTVNKEQQSQSISWRRGVRGRLTSKYIYVVNK